MKELPIIFSGEMVRAILDGRKTQTRRVVKPQPNLGPQGKMISLGGGYWAALDGDMWGEWKCPYGQLGDLLYVREAFTDAIIVGGNQISEICSMCVRLSLLSKIVPSKTLECITAQMVICRRTLTIQSSGNPQSTCRNGPLASGSKSPGSGLSGCRI